MLKAKFTIVGFQPSAGRRGAPHEHRETITLVVEAEDYVLATFEAIARLAPEFRYVRTFAGPVTLVGTLENLPMEAAFYERHGGSPEELFHVIGWDPYVEDSVLSAVWRPNWAAALEHACKVNGAEEGRYFPVGVIRGEVDTLLTAGGLREAFTDIEIENSVSGRRAAL